MRGFFTKCLLAAGMTLVLSGCMMFPLGPDLAKAPSPFGNAPKVTLVDPEKGQDITIVHGPGGDTAVIEASGIVTGIGSRSTFEAGVTWYRLDGKDPDHDDWLVGLNIFKTLDRSAYVIMRYPRGLKITQPLDSDAFEMMPITCNMRGVDPFAKAPEAEAMASYVDGAAETPAPEIASAPAPETQERACDFVDMDEVRAVASDVLVKAQARDRATGEGASGDEISDDYKFAQFRVRIP